MSSFGIFTIVLISLYVVYYAILITRDIYGNKNTIKSEEEEFDVSSLQEEHAAVNVEESENGFSLTPSQANHEVVKRVSSELSGNAVQDDKKIGGRTVSLGMVQDTVAPFTPGIPSGTQGTTAPAEPMSSSGGGTSATQKKIDKIQEEMDEIDPIGNLTMSKEFFRDLLLQANKEGSLFVQKKHVPAV